MDYLGTVLAICGGVSVIGGAGAVVWKVIRPAFRLQGRVSELERRSERDYAAIGKLLESNRAQNRALLAMMNHMIDGNSIDRMKETRDLLESQIIHQ